MLKAFSPAKINLFFQVFQKREDGYHDVFSLYQAIDLCDRLFFSLAEKDSLNCTDPSLATDENNLISKALLLFRKRFSCPPLKIHLEKNIPLQAGLGGGSSNAATTLLALNALTNHPASQEELMQMGSLLGSDVPFFLSGPTAYCRGRGELLEPSVLEKPLQGFIAKPSYGLSTAKVYQAMKEEEMSLQEMKGLSFVNDLEKPAFRLEPRLIAFKQTLLKHFQVVSMTGSGTAFFCLEGTPPKLEGVLFYPFSTLAPEGI